MRPHPSPIENKISLKICFWIQKFLELCFLISAVGSLYGPWVVFFSPSLMRYCCCRSWLVDNDLDSSVSSPSPQLVEPKSVIPPPDNKSTLLELLSLKQKYRNSSCTETTTNLKNNLCQFVTWRPSIIYFLEFFQVQYIKQQMRKIIWHSFY